MKKGMVIIIALFAIVNMVFVANGESPAQSFKVGEVPIVLPPPAREFVEVGNDNRDKFIVHPQNRLISAYALSNEVQKIGSQNLSKYALVEVRRKTENMDWEFSGFQVVVTELKKLSGDKDKMESVRKGTEEEMNRWLKAMDTEKLQVSTPLQLGTFFSKDDAYGSGVIMPLKQGSETAKIGIGATVLRVKKRLLYLYLFNNFENEESIKWLISLSESWADKILKAN